MHTEVYNYRSHLSSDVGDLNNRIAHHKWEAQQLEARRNQLLDTLETLNKTIATNEAYDREQHEKSQEAISDLQDSEPDVINSI